MNGRFCLLALLVASARAAHDDGFAVVQTRAQVQDADPLKAMGVTGQIMVSGSAGIVRDTKVKTGVRDGLAETIGISPRYVTVFVHDTDSGAIRVDYSIRIPDGAKTTSGAAMSAASLESAIAAASAATIGANMLKKIDSAVGSGKYSLTINTVSASQTMVNKARSYGDPHVSNIRGETFDIMQEATHTLLHFPRAANEESTLIKIDAEIQRVEKQWCNGIYIQGITMKGKLLDEIQGPVHFSSDVHEMNTTKAALMNGKTPEEFFKTVDNKKAKAKLSRGDTEWLGLRRPIRTMSVNFDFDGFETIVSWMHHDLSKAGFAQYGKINYLNFKVRGLQNLLNNHDLLEVGGLLGDDDHKMAATRPEVCEKKSLLLGDSEADEGDFGSSMDAEL